MIYLNPPTTPIVDLPLRPDLGYIITPDSDRPNLYSMANLRPWAADNGCFAAGDRFDEERYLFWLLGLRRYVATCLFATAPDVVGDARATWDRSRDWLGCIRTLGYRAAYVAQDGLALELVPWEFFDVFFVGGTTDFKMGDEVGNWIALAKLMGKWVHVGRVNSKKRFDHFKRLGADSADGTFVKFGPDKNIPQMLRWNSD